MSNGRGRPGSAGFKYRHGWIPVAGSGAVDKRSKSAQKKTPSAPPNPAATKDNPTGSAKPGASNKPASSGSSEPAPRRALSREVSDMSDKRLAQQIKQYEATAAATDMHPNMKKSVDEHLAKLKAERDSRKGGPARGERAPRDPASAMSIPPQQASNNPRKPGTQAAAAVDGQVYSGKISHTPSDHPNSFIIDLDEGQEGPDGGSTVEVHKDDLEVGKRALANANRTIDKYDRMKRYNENKKTKKDRMAEVEVQSSSGRNSNANLTEPGTEVTASADDGRDYHGVVVDEEPMIDGAVVLETEEPGPNDDYRLEVQPSALKPRKRK